MIYIPLETTFEIEGRKLQCVVGNKCDNCYFNNQNINTLCSHVLCSRHNRRDGNDVIFKLCPDSKEKRVIPKIRKKIEEIVVDLQKIY